MVAAVPGPLLRALKAAHAWLDEQAVPAAVVGGIAASLLGRPRVTKDVDLVALLPDSEWPQLLEAGQRHGFQPRSADALSFAKIFARAALDAPPHGDRAGLVFCGAAVRA